MNLNSYSTCDYSKLIRCRGLDETSSQASSSEDIAVKIAWIQKMAFHLNIERKKEWKFNLWVFFRFFPFFSFKFDLCISFRDYAIKWKSVRIVGSMGRWEPKSMTFDKHIATIFLLIFRISSFATTEYRHKYPRASLNFTEKP